MIDQDKSPRSSAALSGALPTSGHVWSQMGDGRFVCDECSSIYDVKSRAPIVPCARGVAAPGAPVLVPGSIVAVPKGTVLEHGRAVSMYTPPEFICLCRPGGALAFLELRRINAIIDREDGVGGQCYVYLEGDPILIDGRAANVAEQVTRARRGP